MDVVWVSFQLLLPTFGPGALFIGWGLLKWIAHSGSADDGFRYPWKAALNPVDWLYAGAIIGSQAAWIVLKNSPWNVLASGSVLISVACGLLALAVIETRSRAEEKREQWKPSRKLSCTAGFLLLAAFVSGYLSHLNHDKIMPVGERKVDR